ncbi:hypothetical protein [Lacticaseibacillus nasuensis]|uniref:hypothetical protein n=1 Tax=Lacticaseibacillus nasuensis TaxID=944671 RepID=UPI0006D0FF48|nr:hypothetical protein [Lacticaseibacillus nasuensis]
MKTTKHKLQQAITKERTAYTKLFDAYQAAAAKQDTDTNGALTATNSVLNEDSLLKPAFRDLRVKVLLLQSQLKTTLATTAASSKPATSTKANDSESNENTTNDADTGITAADITKARQQLKDQALTPAHGATMTSKPPLRMRAPLGGIPLKNLTWKIINNTHSRRNGGFFLVQPNKKSAAQARRQFGRISLC